MAKLGCCGESWYISYVIDSSHYFHNSGRQMQFLWFIAGSDGSVTQKMRGSPNDWSEDVKANLLMAIAGLAEEIVGDEVVEYEVDPESDNVIHLNISRGIS
jgi:hypothetical protein